MLETPLVRKIIANLSKRGGFWFKVHGSPMQVAGIPDIIGCYRGLYIAFEVKVPGGKDATPLQAHTIDQIIKAGGVALVIRSVQEAFTILDQVDQILERGN